MSYLVGQRFSPLELVGPGGPPLAAMSDSVALARELEMCYVNISLITDYDVGLEGVEGGTPVSHHEVIEVFNKNNARVKDAIFRIVDKIDIKAPCSCQSALQGARA